MVGGTKTFATPEAVKIPTKKLALLIYMKIPGDGTLFKREDYKKGRSPLSPSP